MKIQHNSRNSFTGIYNNKLLLNGLEKVSEHSTTFSAATSLVMALTVRPLVIHATPNVEKENKQYASSNSIASGLIKFGVVEAVALPLENAIKKIDANSKKYLNKSTITNLGGVEQPISEAKNYRFATQVIKLGAGFVTAIPKSILTVAFIPIIMDNLFKNTVKRSEVQEKFPPQKTGMSFTGKYSEIAPKTVSKLLNAEWYQNFVKRFSTNDKNIAKHITATTDVLLTGVSAYQINTSDKIKENRKKALIYNNVLSTGITLSGGYAIDKFVRAKTSNFVEKFSKIHKDNPKLPKYIEGINIVRPAMIFAAIYYGILPLFSTYLAERIDKHLEKSHNIK